jgi:hypothetical protein
VFRSDLLTQVRHVVIVSFLLDPLASHRRHLVDVLVLIFHRRRHRRMTHDVDHREQVFGGTTHLRSKGVPRTLWD